MISQAVGVPDYYFKWLDHFAILEMSAVSRLSMVSIRSISLDIIVSKFWVEEMVGLDWASTLCWAVMDAYETSGFTFLVGAGWIAGGDGGLLLSWLKILGLRDGNFLFWISLKTAQPL